jgi:predicted flavoprotein YhiN
MSPGNVIVVGAGPGGLMAATRAAERGRQTLLLEKNRRPGVKILLAGGGRCNVTHATDRRGIVAAFGASGKFLHSALAALGPQELVDLLQSEGVPTKVEEGGKVFPRSDRAADVLAVLLGRLDRSGCTLATGEPLLDLARTDDGFRLTTCKPSPPALPDENGDWLRNSLDHHSAATTMSSCAGPRFHPKGEGRDDAASSPKGAGGSVRRTLVAEKVVLATGGRSYPGCGVTGDGYRWAAELGHTIVTPRAALVPVTTHAQWVLDLQGITVADAEVRVVEALAPGPSPRGRGEESAHPSPSGKGEMKSLAQRRGAVLFTHFGLSGPAVLDVSRAVSGHPKPRQLVLVCDFLPAMSDAKLDATLQHECSAAGRQQVGTVLGRLVPQRLAEAILQLAAVSRDCRAAELSAADRRRVANLVKHAPVSVAGTLGFKKAEVTAGGVALDEVDSRTMQSKLVPNLYFVGELLDLDGPVGGYNLQAAFSTGWLAGQSV